MNEVNVSNNNLKSLDLSALNMNYKGVLKLEGNPELTSITLPYNWTWYQKGWWHLRYHSKYYYKKIDKWIKLNTLK